MKVSTTGSLADPDGFLVGVDGRQEIRTGENDSLVFPSVTEGAHSVTVGDLAPNCAIIANPANPIDVVAGDTVLAEIRLACNDPSIRGALALFIGSSPGLPSPAEMRLYVDGRLSSPVALPTGDTTFVILPSGVHLLRIRVLHPLAECAVFPGVMEVDIPIGDTLHRGAYFLCD